MNSVYFASLFAGGFKKDRLAGMLKGIWLGVGISAVLLTVFFSSIYQADITRVRELVAPYVEDESLVFFEGQTVYSDVSKLPGVDMSVTDGYSVMFYAGYLANELGYQMAEKSGQELPVGFMPQLTRMRDTVSELTEMSSALPIVSFLKEADKAVNNIIESYKNNSGDIAAADVLNEAMTILKMAVALSSLVAFVAGIGYAFLLLLVITAIAALVDWVIVCRLFKPEYTTAFARAAKALLIVGLAGILFTVLNPSQVLDTLPKYVTSLTVSIELSIAAISMYNALMRSVKDKVDQLADLYGRPDSISSTVYLALLGIKVRKFVFTYITREEQYEFLTSARGLSTQDRLNCLLQYKDSCNRQQYIYWDNTTDCGDSVKKKHSSVTVVECSLFILVVASFVVALMLFKSNILALKLVASFVPVLALIVSLFTISFVVHVRELHRSEYKDRVSKFASSLEDKLLSIGITASDKTYDANRQSYFVAKSKSISLDSKINTLKLLLTWDKDYPMLIDDTLPDN